MYLALISEMQEDMS